MRRHNSWTQIRAPNHDIGETVLNRISRRGKTTGSLLDGLTDATTLPDKGSGIVRDARKWTFQLTSCCRHGPAGAQNTEGCCHHHRVLPSTGWRDKFYTCICTGQISYSFPKRPVVSQYLSFYCISISSLVYRYHPVCVGSTYICGSCRIRKVHMAMAQAYLNKTFLNLHSTRCQRYHSTSYLHS